MTPRPLAAWGLAIVALSVLTGVLGAAAFLLGTTERGRVTSDDGAFVAIITSQRYESLLPRGPGAGSDAPGVVEVRQVASGRSCGSATVPMVWMGIDLEWNLRATPRTATLVGVAVWNLDTCTVDTSGW